MPSKQTKQYSSEKNKRNPKNKQIKTKKKKKQKKTTTNKPPKIKITEPFFIVTNSYETYYFPWLCLKVPLVIAKSDNFLKRNFLEILKDRKFLRIFFFDLII